MKPNAQPSTDMAQELSEDSFQSNTNQIDIIPKLIPNESDNKELVISNSTDEPRQVSHHHTDEDDIHLKILKIERPVGHLRKKLLVLDVNGLLADIVSPSPKGHKADKIIGKKQAVFMRPFCLDFLNFCFEKFEVGVWSSRTEKYLTRIVNFLMGEMKHKLVFCWDLSRCTKTEFRTLENMHKKLVCKELRRIWEKDDPSLPWEKNDYDESNTLLIDDSPYKALTNPPQTAIFPQPYRFQDKSDNSLAAGGDLREYLVGLVKAENVQKYVEQHPFGQSPINENSKTWDFYQGVISSLSSLKVRDVPPN